MILEIFVLLFCDYSPLQIFQSATNTSKVSAFQPSHKVWIVCAYQIAIACFSFGSGKCAQKQFTKIDPCRYRTVYNNRSKHRDSNKYINTASFLSPWNSTWFRRVTLRSTFQDEQGITLQSLHLLKPTLIYYHSLSLPCTWWTHVLTTSWRWFKSK